VTAAVFESFFSQSREALCVLDVEGRVHHVNASLLIVLGCAEAELVGRPVVELVHPDDRERTTEALQGFAGRGIRGVFDARWRQPDGSYRWMSWQADPHGDLLYCRLRAVTTTDEPLAQTFFDAFPSPVVAFGEDGTCVLSNEAHAQLLGRASSEIVGKRLQDVAYPPSLREAFRAQVERVMATGEPVLLRELRFVALDGHTIWFQVRSLSVRIAGRAVALLVAEDITERRAVETALARSESSFRKLIEYAPDAIFVHRAGSIVYANPLAGKILGYEDAVDLVDLPFRELVAVDDRAMLDRMSGAATELRMVRRDGTAIFVEATQHFVDFDGAEATLLFARDITERRRIQLQLQHADRMVSVGTLAAGVAHEVNNPLAYVLANLDFVQRAVAEIVAMPEAEPLLERLDELQPAIHDAVTGGRRVRDIVADLRTFSSPAEDVRAKPMDVRTVLDTALHMADNEIRHRARLVRSYGEVPRVLGSEARLAQVFLNLLVNAVQALPEGDQHVLRVSTATGPTGAAVVEIEDSGVGIPPSELGRVFDPFYTTKAVGVGTGLGLSICHAIVDALGGSIELESEPGKGTIARITLPAATPVTRSRAVAPAPTTSAAPALRILVVDDEAPIGRVLQKIFGRDHDVTLSTSGEDALENLATKSYDVVFCDLMMPGVSGAEVYRQVSAARPELAASFVFMTAGAFTSTARAFLDTVPNRRVGKPFDFAELRRVLAEFAAKQG
jgi:two-component system, cell cycle sensor histidine kinase and response regulator CckA